MFRPLISILLLSVYLYPAKISQEFKNDKNIIKANSIKHKSKKKLDEKYRLMFQVFNYASDLKNAYKVGQKALKAFPESIYWHKEMAKTCQWLGLHQEAVKHYEFVVGRTHDKEIEKVLLKYALKAYQYEAAAPILKSRAIQKPDEKNIDRLIDIYNKTGTPEEAAKIIEEACKNSGDTKLLSKALKIYIETGNESDVERIVKNMKKKVLYDKSIGEILADYYITRRDMRSAYQALKKIDPKSLGKDSSDYYTQLRDLGWYMQDEKSSAYASAKLFELGKADRDDYERIITYYKDIDPDLSAKAALEASKKIDKRFFITYVHMLFANKSYKKLITAIKTNVPDKLRGDIKKDVSIWLMLGQAYKSLGREKNALQAFKKALSLKPHSPEIKATILWAYIDEKDINSLRNMIFELEEKGKIDKSLYLPLAVANFSLQKVDRAMGYIKKIMKTSKDNLDVKFMYAYLMQARGETGAFMMTMEDIYDNLRSKLSSNPSLKKDPVFMEKYLKSAIYFVPVDKYNRELELAKQILNSRTYTEISIFRALKNRAQERASYLVRRLRDAEPWMQLSSTLYEDDRNRQLSLLHMHYKTLPIRDSVTAAINTGNIALAQSLTFAGLESNRYDSMLYKQMLDLTEDNSNKIFAKIISTQREGLDRYRLDLAGKYFIPEAWILKANSTLVKNIFHGHGSITEVAKNESIFSASVQRKIMKGKLYMQGGVRAAMKTYSFFESKLAYSPISRVSLEADVGVSVLSDETTYLLIGGKKNELKMKASFQYLPSSTISVDFMAQRFYSQNDYNLGKGYKTRAEWYRKIRSGYPDLALGLFAEYGYYNEKDGSLRGNIDELIDYAKAKALPETYYALGLNMSYGMTNKYNFTRIWKPYFSFTPSYYSVLRQINFSLDAGIGGKVFDRDHLDLGVSYSQGIKGTQEESSSIYIKYRYSF